MQRSKAARNKRAKNLKKRAKVDFERMCRQDSGFGMTHKVTARKMTEQEYLDAFGRKMPSTLK